MIVDLRRLDEADELRGQLSANETVTFEDVLGEKRTIDCQVKLSYERSGGAYFFHGELSGEFQTQCYNCLCDVLQHTDGEFDVVVRKKGTEKNVSGGDDEEFLVTLSLNEYEVPFDQHIYESLVVNIPMRILCKDDCRGLCSQCGVNLNDVTCSCTEPGDPRWDALRKLKNE